MGWALTAVVLGSVSLLVVVLTMEPGGQTLAHRSGMAVTGRRSQLLLRRLLLSARAAAITLGHRVASSGGVVVRQAGATAIAVERSVREHIHTFVASRNRPAVSKSPRAASRRPRFEDCLLTTGLDNVDQVDRSAGLSLTPAPSSRGWLSRLASAVELIMVIALAGGAVALTLVAVGWKASRLF